MSRKFADISAF